MPIHVFICQFCKKSFEIFIPISKKIYSRKCKCGGKAIQDIVAEHKAGTIDSQMREYQFEGSTGTRLYPAAVLDHQLGAARKKNPTTEYKKYNNCWIPVIKNRREKLAFLKRNNLEEKD